MKENKPATVLPTREVIVEKEHEDFSDARDFLAQVAILKEIQGPVMRYKITEKGLWYGCWREFKPEKIISKLAEISRTPIEDELKAFIRKTVEKYGTIVVQDYSSEKLECTIKAPNIYERFKERMRTNEVFESYFEPTEGKRFLIEKDLLRGAEETVIKYLGYPFKVEYSPPEDTRFQTEYPTQYSPKINEINAQSRIVIAQELQRLKAKGEFLSNDNLVENHSGVINRINKAFKDYPGEGSRRERAIRLAGINPNKETPLGEDLPGRRTDIQEELQELKDQGIPMLFSYVHKENPGLCTRISEYFSEISEEESSFVKALKFSGLYQGPEERGEIAKKVADGEIEQKILGHLKSDSELQRLTIKIELAEMYRRNESFSHDNFRENHRRLLARIHKFFEDYPGEGTPKLKAIKFSGINPEEVLDHKQLWRLLGETGKKDWIAKKLRRLNKEGGVKSDVHKDGTFYDRIRMNFSTDTEEQSLLEKALIYAGLDPNCLNENKLSSKREKIKTELRELRQEGEELTRESLKENHVGLLRRADKHFGDNSSENSGLYNALQSIGIKPESEMEVDDIWQEMDETKRKEWIKKELLRLKENDELGNFSTKSTLYSRINRNFDKQDAESPLLAALDYADIDPQKGLKSRTYWSVIGEEKQKKRVKEKIIKWLEKGNSLKNLGSKNKSLYSKIYRLFGDLPGEDSAVEKAVRALSIDVDQYEGG